MSSNKIKNKELINDIDLEMKSNYNTNSDILSIDEIPKKEIIISENGTTDPYTEIKMTKQEKNVDKNIDNNKKNNNNQNNSINNNILKENLEVKEKPKDIFGDLSLIIKDKIKTRNTKENNKNKKKRVLSASSIISTEEKNRKLKINMNLKMPSNTICSKNKITKTKTSLSVPKKINNTKKIKKIKKNPEIFINKNIDKKEKNGNLTERKEKKENHKRIKFNDVLKRFNEEEKKGKEKFDNKKKELKNKESKIYTGKPNISKKIGNKYDKFSKDFLTRQKEFNENSNLKKKKLIEEDNKKKEKEYQKIISDSIITKKKKKIKKNRSDDEWVERLYKQDAKKRKIERENMQKAYLPTFKPYLPKKKLFNNSVDKINQIDEVLDKYNEKQNPQLLIDYFSKNNKKFIDYSDNLFRQKIFNKFGNKNKRRNNSVDINEEISEDN